MSQFHHLSEEGLSSDEEEERDPRCDADGDEERDEGEQEVCTVPLGWVRLQRVDKSSSGGGGVRWERHPEDLRRLMEEVDMRKLVAIADAAEEHWLDRLHRYRRMRARRQQQQQEQREQQQEQQREQEPLEEERQRRLALADAATMDRAMVDSATA